MKCPDCGKENSSTSKFCSSCGAKLNKKVNCSQCGNTIEPGAQFCSQCGTKVTGKITSAPKAAKPIYKNKYTHGKSKKSGKSSKAGVNSFVGYAILAIFVIGVTWFIAWSFSSSSRPGRVNSPVSQYRNTSVWSDEVQAIAANFNCPCGTCSDRLDVCTCAEPSGSVEVKTYIKSLLDQGLTKFEAVENVEEKYGNRI
jgi:hypothetical protein